MKKKIALLSILLVFLWAGSVSALGDWCNYSGVKTASGKIFQGVGYFYGVVVTTDGTNTVTLDAYDNIAASGNKLFPQQIIPSSATNRVYAIGFTPPTKVTNGVYISVSVAGGGSYSYVVYY